MPSGSLVAYLLLCTMVWDIFDNVTRQGLKNIRFGGKMITYNLDPAILSIFSVITCAFGVTSKKLLPSARSQRFTPVFFVCLFVF